jgi:hypothetical protein
MNRSIELAEYPSTRSCVDSSGNTLSSIYRDSRFSDIWAFDGQPHAVIHDTLQIVHGSLVRVLGSSLIQMTDPFAAQFTLKNILYRIDGHRLLASVQDPVTRKNYVAYAKDGKCHTYLKVQQCVRIDADHFLMINKEDSRAHIFSYKSDYGEVHPQYINDCRCATVCFNNKIATVTHAAPTALILFKWENEKLVDDRVVYGGRGMDSFESITYFKPTNSLLIAARKDETAYMLTVDETPDKDYRYQILRPCLEEHFACDQGGLVMMRNQRQALLAMYPRHTLFKSYVLDERWEEKDRAYFSDNGQFLTIGNMLWDLRPIREFDRLFYAQPKHMCIALAALMKKNQKKELTNEIKLDFMGWVLQGMPKDFLHKKPASNLLRALQQRELTGASIKKGVLK